MGTGTASRPSWTDTISDATRYLCAGAHLDETFCDEVLAALFGQTWQAVAPSYGFDVAMVSLHCLAARHRRRVRDLLLVTVAFAAFLAGPLPMVLTGLACSRMSGTTGAVEEPADGAPAWRPVTLVALLLACTWSAVLLIAAGHGISARTARLPPGEALRAQLGSVVTFCLVTGHWSFGAGARPVAELIVVAGGIAAAAGWLGFYAVVLGTLIARDQFVLRRLRREAFLASPGGPIPMTRRIRRRLDQIEHMQLGNTTIYSGFSPFKGTGSKLKGWSFAMSFVPAPGRQIQPFTVADLARHVSQRVGELARPEAVEDRGFELDNSGIPGLTVSDQIFVSGERIGADTRFFPGRDRSPSTHLEVVHVDEIVRRSRGAARHYCAARVRSWGGEVVTFTFFHFAVSGGKLYFECVRRALHPVRNDFHRVDTMPDRLAEALPRLMAEAAAATARAVLGAPRRLLTDIRFDHWAERPPRDVTIDHGAHLYVREHGSESAFHNYFQELDTEKHLKIVERGALVAMAEFLSSHGVDTAEFMTQQATILQASIIQIGAGNTVGAFAQGDQATATSTQGPGVAPASQES
jgi:hypothetical protein